MPSRVQWCLSHFSTFGEGNRLTIVRQHFRSLSAQYRAESTRTHKRYERSTLRGNITQQRNSV